MTNFKGSLFLAIAGLIALSTAAQAESVPVTFSTSVTDEQAKQLSADLALSFTLVDDAKVKSVMEVGSLSDAALKSWLADRVHFIIGESEDAHSNLGIVQQDYAYQNPGVLPDFEHPSVQALPPTKKGPIVTDAVEKAMVVMSNTGTGLYFMGKDERALLGYKLTTKSGEQVVPIKSPRVGLIQIGEGLFKIMVNPQNPKAVANGYFRVATLFHEAHHGDGNSKSLGFAHAVCPKGHAYANLNACDRNGNGPYTVGAGITKQVRATCVQNKTCTAGEAEILATDALDSYSRVLDQKMWDSKPEGI